MICGLERYLQGKRPIRTSKDAYKIWAVARQDVVNGVARCNDAPPACLCRAFGEPTHHVTRFFTMKSLPISVSATGYVEGGQTHNWRSGMTVMTSPLRRDAVGNDVNSKTLALDTLSTFVVTSITHQACCPFHLDDQAGSQCMSAGRARASRGPRQSTSVD